MDIGAYIAASGAIASERILEQVTHNLTNGSTPGFKRAMVPMQAFPFSLPRAEWTGSDPLAFVQVRPAVIPDEQGTIEPTGQPLDLAIEGKGYFSVRTPEGSRAVRSGRFRLGPEGTLVTWEGYAVEDDRGQEVRMDDGQKVEISENGEIRSGEKRIGRLRIVDEQGGPLEEGDYRIAQGHLENSNVNAIEEMVKMMDLLRSHGAYMNVIRGLDDLEGKTVQELGRV